MVVHVLHHGEDVGNGPNLSVQRINRQIEVLNEDFRRKEGTRGFNNHEDGADSEMEVVLAKKTPEGQKTDGINRVNIDLYDFPSLGYSQNHYAQYAYWNPEKYINIWITPLPVSTSCVSLGMATGPQTDLPGTEYLSLPGPTDAEGILINWMHFGESEVDCHAKYGRTLTHEMGHYFGLLHTWGDGKCETNDYCDDTPAVDKAVSGSVVFNGCNGEPVMMGNYMNYSDDAVMNIFTEDQVKRMHYVIENHPGRSALLSSNVINPD